MTLPLADPAGAEMPVMRWPIALEAEAPFDDEARFFEPWWPGAQAFLRLDSGAASLRTEHMSDPLEVFPVLRRLAHDVEATQAVIVGTLLALDAEGRPDTSLLRASLSHTAVAPGSGAFVATDVAWLDGQDLRRLAYRERRQRLASVLVESDNAVVSRGLIGEGRTLAHAVASMGLDAISARRLDGRWPAARGSDGWLRVPLGERAAPRTGPFLVLLERLPLEA